MAADKIYNIVLDVMGDETGEGRIIQGGIDAATLLHGSARVTFVGPKPTIEAVLAKKYDLPDNLDIKHAESVVPMHISATDGVRMRDSSMAVGLKLVKAGEADAFVSPGNTGAVMATALLSLGRIEDVSRPAITAMFPTATGRPTWRQCRLQAAAPFSICRDGVRVLIHRFQQRITTRGIAVNRRGTQQG